MAKPFRLYVCSDIHASERTWRKFLNAMRANVYKVDAAVIAGDLTGKALIAVVRGDEGGEVWTATVLGQRRVARTEAELVALERSIADLGYYARPGRPRRSGPRWRPIRLSSAGTSSDLITRRVREWMALAAERLEGSGVPVYLMPGNDDDFEIDPILAESTYCQNVNEQVVELTPWHQLVSMGWSSPTPWSTPRELPEEEFLDRLSGLLARRPRSAPDGDDDPRPAVRLRPRHGSAPVAGPPPDGDRGRPDPGPGRLDRGPRRDRDVQAGPRRARPHPRVRRRAPDRATRSA